MKTFILLLICIQFLSIYPLLIEKTEDRVSRLRSIHIFPRPVRARILDQSNLGVQRKYALEYRRYPIPKPAQFLCQMCLKIEGQSSLDSKDCSRYCPGFESPPYFDLNFGRRF